MAFIDRHIGPDDADQARMLAFLGYDDLEQFSRAVVPDVIRWQEQLNLQPAVDEPEALELLAGHAQRNRFGDHIGGV